MNKEELIERKVALETELQKVRSALSNIDEEELKKKYGNEFSCEFCRYNAVFGLSYDSWHNMCGNDNCTCCHSYCEKYKPDNEATLLIKKTKDGDGLLRSKKTNGYGNISDDERNALDELGANIFADNPSPYTMELLRLFLNKAKKRSLNKR